MANHHIILPKSTLLRFSDKSGSFYYLDLHDQVIKCERATNFYTCNDFYPDNIERLLSNRVETRLGRINSKLEEIFSNNQDTFCFPENLLDDVISVIAIQRMRMPQMFKIGLQKSVIAQFLKWPDIASILQIKDYDIEAGINIFKNLFKDHTPTFSFIQDCSSSFILPSAHCFSCKNIVYLVLSPLKAIVLCPKDINIHDNTGATGFEVIDEEDHFVKYYSNIIQDELENGEGFLVGLQPELKKIQKLMKAGILL